MSFADPLANVTLATVAQTLPRTISVGQKTTYRKSDGTLIATVSHQATKGINPRVRSMLRLDQFLDTNSDLILEDLGVYIVIDRPLSGFTAAQVKDLVTCLTDLLQASSKAAVDKLYNQET